MTTPPNNHDAVTAEWAQTLLHFWFNDVGPEGWWTHDSSLDFMVQQRFLVLWQEKRALPASFFLTRADEALAAIILFDQLPRHMFRRTAEAFVSDALAREIARGAVAHGYDIQIGGSGRIFFYMPFMHSEDLEDQRLSMQLFEKAGDPNSLEFAKKHMAVIAEFGRFPHRNAVLDRPSRPEEAEAIKLGSSW